MILKNCSIQRGEGGKYIDKPNWRQVQTELGFPRGALVVENPPASAGGIRDVGSMPGSGRSPGGGHGSLQYPCLENPMDRGAWTPAHRVTESDTTEAT